MIFQRHRLPSLRPEFAPILRNETNVLSIPRPMDRFMLRRLNSVAAQRPFAHSARLDTATPDPTALLASVVDPLAREFLRADIQDLATQLGTLLGRKHLSAKFFIQRTNGCRKIHADNVTIRLVCTYAGPGTDWLPNEDVIRKNLGRTDVDIETANLSVRRDGATLRRCEPGELLLLKGKKYPGNEGRGAAHRSPPLEEQGLSRLVLKIDEHACGC